MSAPTCHICSTAIEATGKGRPPTYCSTGCRRMAEYDIRRLKSTIENLEGRARNLRNPAFAMVNQGEGAAAEVEFLAAEIASARKQLRDLLAI